MKLILHIGSDKCGSTAIQRSLAINRDQLKEHGIYIPETGLRDNSGHACCFNREHPNNNELFHDLVKELKSVSSSYEIAIVSWEGIHFIKESVLHEKYHLLRQFDTKVIYYVREQAEIIQTGILQQWKTHNCGLPFNKITPNSRMYHATADRWSKFIGNKVEVIAYDVSVFPESDICLDFYSRVTSKHILLKKSDEIIDNPSLSYESAYLLAFLDTNFGITEDDRPDLVNAISRSQIRSIHSKYFFSEKEVKEIRQHYEESNKILKAEYGADLFSNLKPSWRTAEKSNGLDPELLAKSLELYGIPILKNNQNIQFKLNKALVSGWYKIENWGVWANGQESKILFRLDDKIIKNDLGKSGKIDIEITGQYYKSVDKKSDLEINGRNFKNMDLSQFRFTMTTDDLFEDGRVEIIIKNGLGTSELPKYNNRGARELSFGLKNIRFVDDQSGADNKRKIRRKKNSKFSNKSATNKCRNIIWRIMNVFRR